MGSLYVQGQSGRIYEIGLGAIYLFDGLGRRVARTCWDSSWLFPEVDRYWSMALALRFDEARVWETFPWHGLEKL